MTCVCLTRFTIRQWLMNEVIPASYERVRTLALVEQVFDYKFKPIHFLCKQ